MDRSGKIRLLFAGICFVLFAWLMCIMVEKGQENSAVYLESEPVVAQEDEGKKIMYLTFDDGPSQNTQAVLDILEEYDAKATFFVTAEFSDYLHLIRAEKEAGHAIGVHTYSHRYDQIYADSASFWDDVEKMQKIIEEQCGSRTSILRFPGGTSNTISQRYAQGIMSQLAEEAEQKQYAYYDWNATNGDGDTSLSAQQLVEQAKREIGEQPVVMLLMHDGAGNEASVKALSQILSYIRDQGYEFRVIDELTPVFHHHINN